MQQCLGDVGIGSGETREACLELRQVADGFGNLLALMVGFFHAVRIVVDVGLLVGILGSLSQRPQVLQAGIIGVRGFLCRGKHRFMFRVSIGIECRRCLIACDAELVHTAIVINPFAIKLVLHVVNDIQILYMLNLGPAVILGKGGLYGIRVIHKVDDEHLILTRKCPVQAR